MRIVLLTILVLVTVFGSGRGLAEPTTVEPVFGARTLAAPEPRAHPLDGAGPSFDEDGLVTLEGVLRFIRAGDVDALETRFSALQAALVAGRIETPRYRRPFLAFASGLRELAMLVDRWERRYPGSALPPAARGLQLAFIGRVHRGEAPVVRTPRLALDRAADAFGRARPALEVALARDPDLLVAAETLLSIDRLAQGTTREPVAAAYRRAALHASVERLSDPIATMRRRVVTLLPRRLPRRGGAWRAVDAFCADWAARHDAIALDECHAVARLHSADRRERDGALATLRRIAPERHALAIAETLIRHGRRGEGFDVVRRHGLVFPRSRLVELGLPRDIAEAQLNFWQLIDIAEPNLLHLRSRLEWYANGDADAALRSIEGALAVLPHDPGMHRHRLAILSGAGRDSDLLPALEAAARDTAGEVESYLPVLYEVLAEPERFRTRPDGRPHRRFGCRLQSLMTTTRRHCERPPGGSASCPSVFGAKNATAGLWQRRERGLSAKECL